MFLLITISVLAAIAGFLLPIRWGVVGFLAAVLLLFAVQTGINTAGGFAGSSIEESLLLFNGSWVSYVGFNLQITYRAFALPLLIMSTLSIYRANKHARTSAL